MIVTRLVGGLGNQLFQYAAGRSLAARYRTSLKFDIQTFTDDKLRRFTLDRFRIEVEAITPQERASLRIGAPPSRGARRVIDRILHGRPMPIFRESSFEYDPSWETAPAHCYLEGYWQSPRYFEGVADVIRSEAVVREEPSPANRATAASISSTMAVSVHVRRGDYVNNPDTNLYHGTCGPDYYTLAEARVAERHGGIHLFVFSDDPDWAEANLRFFSPFTVLRHNDAGHDYEDLRLMALCRHHIIANSSFSWWGAWLCTHPDKLVIAPRRWFRGAAHDTSDLIPPEWLRL